MARRSRSSKRRINYLHLVFWVLSFVVVLSMVLAMLPLAR
jgi:hypothetical protein